MKEKERGEVDIELMMMNYVCDGLCGVYFSKSIIGPPDMCIDLESPSYINNDAFYIIILKIHLKSRLIAWANSITRFYFFSLLNFRCAGSDLLIYFTTSFSRSSDLMGIFDMRQI